MLHMTRTAVQLYQRLFENKAAAQILLEQHSHFRWLKIFIYCVAEQPAIISVDLIFAESSINNLKKCHGLTS